MDYREDIEELAAAVLGQTEAYEDGDYVHFDDEMEATFGVNLEQFERIVLALIPFTEGWMSPITDTHYQGFVNGHKVLFKQPVETDA
jgi:hypothetical protein